MKELNIRKDAASIGWMLLLGQIFMQGATLIVMVIGFLMGVKDSLIIGSDIGSFIANFIILGIFYMRRKADIPLFNTTHNNRPLYLCLICTLSVIFINGIVSTLDYITNQKLSISFNDLENTGSIVTNMFLISIFPAVVEEFAFRKVIFGTMRQYGFGIAAIFSSIIFGLLHQNFIQLIFAFGLGMVLCYIYEHTGKLIYCILVHFVNNAYSVILSFAPISASIKIFIEVGIGIIGVITVIILFSTKRINIAMLLRINGVDDKRHLAVQFRECFSRVSIIIFTVFCTVMCIITVMI